MTSKTTNFFFIIFLSVTTKVWAAEVRLGVSQSIQSPLSVICLDFAQKTKHNCKITYSSTGHLYAQSMHSDVFDVMIGSNLDYTRGLMTSGRGNIKHHKIVARSRVILWSSDETQTPRSLFYALMHEPEVPIVIPKQSIANYGVSVKSILQALNIWGRVQKRLIIAQSISHAYALLSNNKRYIGFTTLSQLNLNERDSMAFWEPTLINYKQVLHDALVFTKVTYDTVQREFLSFLSSEQACDAFEHAGYDCWDKLAQAE